LVAATYGRGIYTFKFAAGIKGNNPCEVRAGGGDLADFVLVPPERVHSGIHAWWSGSQGGSDSNVTRSISVPAGATTLKFWTWFNLEDGFDWAYVLVSVDNGVTWEPLPTVAANGSGTTPLDPIGGYPAVEGGSPAGGSKKYLYGFTGVSGYPPTYSGQNGLESTTGVPNPWGGIVVPVYTEQTAAITTYAGKTILLRFAYSSDPAVDLDNFYVDDVTISGTLGNVLFKDDMENGSLWQASGAPGFKHVTVSN
jgi:immune inhibitor A